MTGAPTAGDTAAAPSAVYLLSYGTKHRLFVAALLALPVLPLGEGAFAQN